MMKGNLKMRHKYACRGPESFKSYVGPCVVIALTSADAPKRIGPIPNSLSLCILVLYYWWILVVRLALWDFRKNGTKNS